MMITTKVWGLTRTNLLENVQATLLAEFQIKKSDVEVPPLELFDRLLSTCCRGDLMIHRFEGQGKCAADILFIINHQHAHAGLYRNLREMKMPAGVRQP